MGECDRGSTNSGQHDIKNMAALYSFVVSFKYLKLISTPILILIGKYMLNITVAFVFECMVI